MMDEEGERSSDPFMSGKTQDAWKRKLQESFVSIQIEKVFYSFIIPITIIFHYHTHVINAQMVFINPATFVRKKNSMQSSPCITRSKIYFLSNSTLASNVSSLFYSQILLV